MEAVQYRLVNETMGLAGWTSHASLAVMFSRSSSTAACWGDPDDALSKVLLDIRLSGSSFCRAELGAPWGLDVPKRPFAVFHFVAEGSCWLRREGELVELAAGDLVLLPRGDAHVLSNLPGGSGQMIDSLPHEKISETASVLRHGGSGASSVVVCGGVEFEGFASQLLTEVLPSVVIVRRGADDGELMGGVMAAMAHEAMTSRPGVLTMMTRLADAVVIHAVRSWIETGAQGASGWLGAVRDPQIGRALALVHAEPETAWTVERLAESAHMSRSAFSERFSTLLGVGPMHFVTRLRMHRASELLRREPTTIAELAARLGYESEHAFARAFKRHMGIPPGAARRTALL